MINNFFVRIVVLKKNCIKVEQHIEWSEIERNKCMHRKLHLHS